jgi:hypothetical protein
MPRTRRVVAPWKLAAIFWAVATAAWADALDRMHPDKLRAVHEAIETLKTQRRIVILSSGFDDVRTLLHVHSELSHDSRGTLEEIVTDAKAAGVRVILFTEHPSNDVDYFLEGHRGVVDGVLLIPGAETEGFLAFPRRSIQAQKTESPQAFADLVMSTGGLAFVSHLEERMDWMIDRVTGMEIYNTHADFKDEKRFVAALLSPLSFVTISNSLKQYPQEVFGALLDYPADYLRRYDELCLRARQTGVAANDAHHNQAYRVRLHDDGIVQLEDALGTVVTRLDLSTLGPLGALAAGRESGDVLFELDLDPYVRSFRHVSTHLLLRETTEKQVWEALSEGRAYVSFDWLADPTGFVYEAVRSGEKWHIGSELPMADGLRLRAEAPLEGRFKLIRDGAAIFDQVSTKIDYLVKGPGVYRVEVWLSVAGEERPWILSNPIYVRGNE